MCHVVQRHKSVQRENVFKTKQKKEKKANGDSLTGSTIMKVEW